MRSQIQTNNVNSTELWVELDEQQSSELSGGFSAITIGDINTGDLIIDNDPDLIDSSEKLLNLFK